MSGRCGATGSGDCTAYSAPPAVAECDKVGANDTSSLSVDW